MWPKICLYSYRINWAPMAHFQITLNLGLFSFVPSELVFKTYKLRHRLWCCHRFSCEKLWLFVKQCCKNESTFLFLQVSWVVEEVFLLLIIQHNTYKEQVKFNPFILELLKGLFFHRTVIKRKANQMPFKYVVGCSDAKYMKRVKHNYPMT